MVSFSSYALDKLALSVVEGSGSQLVYRNGYPAMQHNLVIDIDEARIILQRWFRQLGSSDPNKEIVLILSDHQYTDEGAIELARFTSLATIANRIVAIEIGGYAKVVGSRPYLSVRDAEDSQCFLVNSLISNTCYRAVKIDGVDDSNIDVPLRLMENTSVTMFELSNSNIAIQPNKGLVKLQATLTNAITHLTHRPCEFLEHLGITNVKFDDPDRAAEVFAAFYRNALPSRVSTTPTAIQAAKVWR